MFQQQKYNQAFVQLKELFVLAKYKSTINTLKRITQCTYFIIVYSKSSIVKILRLNFLQFYLKREGRKEIILCITHLPKMVIWLPWMGRFSLYSCLIDTCILRQLDCLIPHKNKPVFSKLIDCDINPMRTAIMYM